MPTLRSLRPAAPPPGNEDPLMSDPITQQQVCNRRTRDRPPRRLVPFALDSRGRAIPRVAQFNPRDEPRPRPPNCGDGGLDLRRGHHGLRGELGVRARRARRDARPPHRCQSSQAGVDAVLALSKDHPGLSDMLEDRVPLSRAIRPTISKSLDALTAGRSIDSPAEVLRARAPQAAARRAQTQL